MSSQPGDPRPQDPAPSPPGDRAVETDTPPPGFVGQARSILSNRYALLIAAIVITLFLLLAIIVATSDESSSDGPEPGAAVPGLRAPSPVLAHG